MDTVILLTLVYGLQFCFVQGEPCTHQSMAKSDSQVVYEGYLYSIMENCITSFIAFDVRRTCVVHTKIFWAFRSWTAIWTPLLVFAGAGLVLESGRPHGRILVGLVFIAVRGCCTWLVADIVTILSCLCYNLNGQKLYWVTLYQHNYQMPFRNFTSFVLANLIWQLSSSTRLRSGNTGKILLCVVRGFNQLNI